MRFSSSVAGFGFALVFWIVAPGCGIAGPLAQLFPLPLNIDIDAQIKATTTGPIDSVTLSTLTLTITSTAEPAGDLDDWSFVDRIDVYVSGAGSGSMIPRARIAHVTSQLAGVRPKTRSPTPVLVCSRSIRCEPASAGHLPGSPARR
jgi:hypothetical protein